MLGLTQLCARYHHTATYCARNKSNRQLFDSLIHVNRGGNPVFGRGKLFCNIMQLNPRLVLWVIVERIQKEFKNIAQRSDVGCCKRSLVWKNICSFTTESSKRRFQGLPFNINHAYLISFPITGNRVPPANDKLIYWKFLLLSKRAWRRRLNQWVNLVWRTYSHGRSSPKIQYQLSLISCFTCTLTP